MTKTEAKQAWEERISSLIVNSDELTIEDVPDTVLDEYMAAVKAKIHAIYKSKRDTTIRMTPESFYELLDTTGPL